MENNYSNLFYYISVGRREEKELSFMAFSLFIGEHGRARLPAPAPGLHGNFWKMMSAMF